MPYGPVDSWIAIIFCDYGQDGVKLPICRSYTEKSAENSWKKYKKRFSKNGFRCWQENKKGKILNDSKL